MGHPVFPEGITTPVRLMGMKEVFHPSAGENHSHWFYEFEPDFEQAALLERERTPDSETDDLETLMWGDQKVTISPFRVGCKRPTVSLGVGELYDVILVRREPIEVPELSGSGLQRLLSHIFQPSENESNIVAIVPLVDLEAAEYDLPPDIEGLPDLTHVDGGQWMNMSTVQRLTVIAEARKSQK